MHRPGDTSEFCCPRVGMDDKPLLFMTNHQVFPIIIFATYNLRLRLKR